MNTLFSRLPLAGQKTDGLVVFFLKNKPLLPASSTAQGKALAQLIRDWSECTSYSGKPNEVSVFPTWGRVPAQFVWLVGLGSKEEFHPGRLYQAAGSLARQATKLKRRRLAFSLNALASELPLTADAILQTLVEGLSYGAYEFSSFSPSARGKKNKGFETLVIADATPSGARALKAALAAAHTIAASIHEVRDLANLPGNEATPDRIVSFSRSLATRHGLQCTALRRKELRRKGCGALLAVGQGSRQEPALLILKYRGRRPSLKPLVLVGKTITFDTGGISLKPSKSMEWMKYDKCGGMAVLAVMRIVARLKPERPVIGLLAVAENMPGGGAIRPGDIITAHSGLTIEVLNTDAEGRLVLADALSVAAAFNPEAMVDLATLTGAVIVALGHSMSAIMGNSDRLVEDLRRAGAACGERLHPLPLLPEHGEALRGAFSDVKNIASENVGAGTLVGGAFLREFVRPGIPWAHLDIAGTAWEECARPYAAPGATLFGARLLVEWIRSHSTGRRKNNA